MDHSLRWQCGSQTEQGPWITVASDDVAIRDHVKKTGARLFFWTHCIAQDGNFWRFPGARGARGRPNLNENDNTPRPQVIPSAMIGSKSSLWEHATPGHRT